MNIMVKNKVTLIDEDVIKDFIDLILDMTEYEVHNRITPSGGLVHRFMMDDTYDAYDAYDAYHDFVAHAYTYHL